LRVAVLGCAPISQFARFEALRKAHNAELFAICDVAEVQAEKMAAVPGPHDPAKALQWIQAARTVIRQRPTPR
jgi:predicted dehydrogenase